jgi:hypothetical protein
MNTTFASGQTLMVQNHATGLDFQIPIGTAYEFTHSISRATAEEISSKNLLDGSGIELMGRVHENRWIPIFPTDMTCQSGELKYPKNIDRFELWV